MSLLSNDRKNNRTFGNGTWDPDGPSLLEQAITIEQPDMLTTEASPKLAAYVISGAHRQDLTRRYSRYRKQGLHPWVFEFMRRHIRDVQGYEVIIPCKYAQLHNIPMHHVEDEREYERVRNNIERPLDGDVSSMNSVNEQNMRKDIEEFCQLTESIFSIDNPQSEYNVAAEFDPEVMTGGYDLDSIAATNILQSFTQGKKLVHVCGMGHLYRDAAGSYLYGRLLQTKTNECNLERRTVRNKKYLVTSSSL